MNVRPGAFSFAASGAAVAASLLAYPFLPRRVATHFRADGRPDRESVRAVAALGLPAVMVGIALLNEGVWSWPGGSDREDGDSGARARKQAVNVAELGLLANNLALLAYGLSLPVDMARVPRAIYGLCSSASAKFCPRCRATGRTNSARVVHALICPDLL